MEKQLQAQVDSLHRIIADTNRRFLDVLDERDAMITKLRAIQGGIDAQLGRANSEVVKANAENKKLRDQIGELQKADANTEAVLKNFNNMESILVELYDYASGDSDDNFVSITHETLLRLIASGKVTSSSLISDIRKRRVKRKSAEDSDDS